MGIRSPDLVQMICEWAEALRHYQDLDALLKRELSTEPDAATRSLVAELRSTAPPGRSAGNIA